MKQQSKNDCLEMLDSLNEAHEAIFGKTKIENVRTALTILEDCQQAAISIGTLIEQSEGEGTDAVVLLEGYCEYIYQLHCEVDEGESVDNRKVSKKLTKDIRRIRNEINAIQSQYEIVFLPYKASMWDSMESIWMAAAADESCDAYVIPIPYYDRNQDGSFAAIHYEADEFPNEVPITKYNEYDFAERHPDVIYFCNPYDDWNLVTSVHPDFYSDKLKAYTDCLVYTPYYSVGGNILGEGQKYGPGLVNADYIIAQSEAIKKEYDKRIARDKILVLGSPKFDRIIRICNNHSEPPEEWKEKLKDKKVFFYNTSLAGLLEDTGVFLRKMAYVFNTAKEVDGACIIWRPHPLFESTLDSMRPEFRFVYDMLREAFIQEEVGVFDDTPDIEMTISHCDAYIGDDGSSVVSLFMAAGKPLFMLDKRMNLKQPEDYWKKWLPFSFSGTDSNKYYFSAFNRLYEDISGHYTIRLKKEFTGKKEYQYYTRACEVCGKTILCPRVDEEIHILESDGRIRVVSLPKRMSRSRNREDSLFFSGIVWEDYVFLIPYKYPALVRFDVRNEKIDLVEDVSSYYIDTKDGEDRIGGFFFFRENFGFHNIGKSEIMTVDSHTLEIKKHHVKFDSQGHFTATDMYSDELWFLPDEGTSVMRWNVRSDKYDVFDLGVKGLQAYSRPDFKECNEKYFANMVMRKDGCVIFSPNLANKFVILNPDTKEANEWDSPIEVYTRDRDDYLDNINAGSFLRKIDFPIGKSYYWRWYDRRLFMVDLNEGSVAEEKLDFLEEECVPDIDEWNGFIVPKDSDLYCCVESPVNSLEAILKGVIKGEDFSLIKQQERFSKINVCTDSNCGRKVHERILELL